MVSDNDFEFSDEWPQFDEIRPGHEILFKRDISPEDLAKGGLALRYLQALAGRAGRDGWRVTSLKASDRLLAGDVPG